jgi:glutathione peroxidase
MYSKIKTAGDGQSPVFRYLSADYGEPKWNFHKYLVSKKGRVIKAFPTSTAPDDPKLRAAIEAALEEEPAQG